MQTGFCIITLEICLDLNGFWLIAARSDRTCFAVYEIGIIHLHDKMHSNLVDFIKI